MNFQYERNQIFLDSPEGETIAKVTFPTVTEGVVEIDHTFVDDSLRGQGVAGKLMEAVSCQLREDGRKAHLTCPFAQKWFESHPEHSDLLAP